MKILFLSPLVPSVAYGHRPYSFLTWLAEQGHEITLLALADPGPVTDAQVRLEKKGIRVLTVPAPRMVRWWNCLSGWFSKVPLRILHCKNRLLLQQLLKEAGSGSHDVLHVDRFRLAPYALAAREVFKGRILIDFPDALSLYYKRAVQNPRHRLKALIDRREYQRIPPYETGLLKEKGLEVIVCSEVDRNHLQQSGPTIPIHVIPNNVDMKEFCPRQRPDGVSRLVFTGTLYYLPNIDGLLWFQQEVLPLLKREVQIEVLGYGATSELDPVRKDPRFHFRGYVANMAEHLFQDDVYLCPIRIAAGTRFKLLEAFSAGMACVSTTIGYEGLPCLPDQQLLVADDPQTFADAVQRLLNDREKRRQLGVRAREFVRERYSLEAAGKALEKLYQK